MSTDNIKVRGVFVFNNGMVAVTDMQGQQIPELQGSLPEHCERRLAHGDKYDYSTAEFHGRYPHEAFNEQD